VRIVPSSKESPEDVRISSACVCVCESTTDLSNADDVPKLFASNSIFVFSSTSSSYDDTVLTEMIEMINNTLKLFKNILLFLFIYICIRMRIYVCVRIYMCVYMCVCVYELVCVCVMIS
jgi:hypothetical protein